MCWLPTFDALLDSGGHVVGLIVSKLNAYKVQEKTGDLPQNVNFAIKSSTITNFLEANDIAYSVANSTNGNLDSADIVDGARRYTVLVKEGPEMGRGYLVCKLKDRCRYFQWADAPYSEDCKE